jgi:hypothetical protein
MEASRIRVDALLEWAVAAVFIVAVLAAGASIARQVRSVSAVMPVMARAREVPPPPPPAPAAVPARAVSVPLLLLSDGTRVSAGETLTRIAERFGRQAETGMQSVERAPNGERLTRFYEHAGSRFVLVFEPLEPEAEPTVTAIYLQ